MSTLSTLQLTIRGYQMPGGAGRRETSDEEQPSPDSGVSLVTIITRGSVIARVSGQALESLTVFYLQE